MSRRILTVSFQPFAHGHGVRLLYQRGDRVAVALHADKEGFGRSEPEEEVETNGDMVDIIGDVEVDNTLERAVILFKIRELQTAVLPAVVGLDGGTSTKDQSGRCRTVAVGNGEVDHITFLPVVGVKGACPKEDIHHVVDTLSHVVLFPGMRTIVFLTVLDDMASLFGISIEDLVDGVSLTLVRTLAEVERSHLHRTVTEQRVAQHEHIVYPLIATGDQRSAVSLLAAVMAQYGRHGSCTGFHPYKFPIIIEIIA